MIYFRVQQANGKILAGNMQDFSKAEYFENRKNFVEKEGKSRLKGAYETVDNITVWVVVENETDLLNSSKLFKKTFKIYKMVALDIWKYHQKQIDAYAHVLNAIQAQIRQQIEGFADDSVFYAETYAGSVQNILALLEDDKESASDLICYIHKRVADMRAHLLGAEVIHSGELYEVKPVRVSLKRAILCQCTPFLEELENNLVRVRFFFEDDCEVEVDKHMFSLVMYNFFSNALKYTKDDTEIRLKYSTNSRNLDISMVSLKMEKSELANLYKEGTRGIHAKNIAGKGIGLFVVQRALDLMNKEHMYISPNFQKSYSSNGSVYVENHFTFVL